MLRYSLSFRLSDNCVLVQSKRDHGIFYLNSLRQNFQIHIRKKWDKKITKKKCPQCATQLRDFRLRWIIRRNYRYLGYIPNASPLQRGFSWRKKKWNEPFFKVKRICLIFPCAPVPFPTWCPVQQTSTAPRRPPCWRRPPSWRRPSRQG